MCTAAHSPCAKETRTALSQDSSYVTPLTGSYQATPIPHSLWLQTDSSLSTAGLVLPQSLNNQLHGHFWHKVTFNTTKVMLPLQGMIALSQIP